jgi:biotin carboxyl carrier protein
LSEQTYLAISGRARAAATPEALAFIACNDTLALIDYRQAALIAFDAFGRSRLIGHSGLAATEADAPYSLWLGELVAAIRPQLEALPESAPLLAVSAEQVPETLAATWNQWLPPHLWALPLRGPDHRTRAVLLLARDEPWPAAIAAGSAEGLLLSMIEVYGHAWWALSARGLRIGERLRGWWRSKQLRWILALSLLLLLIPVREYTLAPAEVVSLQSQVISSPMDGVIRRISVAPNSPVNQGDVIAELDATSQRNRVAVARAALATARAEFLQSSQRAFESQQAKADLVQSQARVRESEAELAWLSEDLSRLQIRAPAAGVFVYSDPDDWSGKPVQTGERIGLLADPKTLGVQAWVPVGEAINLTPGAPMTLFLRIAPLNPIAAKLDFAGYQVIESPEAIASYRVRGTLTGASTDARVGLRGTVRIGGDWTVLGYLLLRRPLAWTREWCGC